MKLSRIPFAILLAGWGILSGCNCQGPWSSDPSLYDLSYQADETAVLLLVETELNEEADVNGVGYTFDITSATFSAAMAGRTTTDADCNVNSDGNVSCVVDFNDPDFVREKVCAAGGDSDLFIHSQFEYEINGTPQDEPGYFITPALDVRGIAYADGGVDICAGFCPAVACADGCEFNPTICGCSCPGGEVFPGGEVGDEVAGTSEEFDADDPDGDGFSMDVDNCPVDANPDQIDTDGDEIGNVCDECPLLNREASLEGQAITETLFANAPLGCPPGTNRTTSPNLAATNNSGGGGGCMNLGTTNSPAPWGWLGFVVILLLGIRFKKQLYLLLFSLVFLTGCLFPQQIEDYELVFIKAVYLVRANLEVGNYFENRSDSFEDYEYEFDACLVEGGECHLEHQDAEGNWTSAHNVCNCDDWQPCELDEGEDYLLTCEIPESWVEEDKEFRIAERMDSERFGKKVTSGLSPVLSASLLNFEAPEESQDDDPPSEPSDDEGGGGGGGGGDGGGGGGGVACAEACGAGLVCDPASGACVAAEPEGGELCEDVECSPNQYCDNTDGLCKELPTSSFADGSDDDDLTLGSGNNSGSQNANNNQENPLACALNPSQCADTKGWCSLNPEAKFQPFFLLPLLIVVSAGLLRRLAAPRNDN